MLYPSTPSIKAPPHPRPTQHLRLLPRARPHSPDPAHPAPAQPVQIVQLVLARVHACARACSPVPFALAHAGRVDGECFPDVGAAELDAEAGAEEEVDDEEEAGV